MRVATAVSAFLLMCFPLRAAEAQHAELPVSSQPSSPPSHPPYILAFSSNALSPALRADRSWEISISADSSPRAARAHVVPISNQGALRRWWVPLVSAAAPGAGQLLLRENRALGYLVVESFGWLQYFHERGAGLARRRDYQRLARVVARSAFSDTLPDGDFEYYETMERFVESGVFDLDPGSQLNPETNENTYNGSIWLLARRTFWRDPSVTPERDSEAYLRAEEFYLRRAIRPEYRWSWRNSQLEQDLFRRTIQQSNGAFRLASTYLGVIIANHALSAVDAYITLRVTRGDGASRYGLNARIPWAPLGRPRSRDTRERARGEGGSCGKCGGRP